MIRIDNLPEIFVKAMPVLRTLEDAGFEAYFVGGSVRDVLLHRHVHDVDITTSAYPEEVKELFDKSIDFDCFVEFILFCLSIVTFSK